MSAEYIPASVSNTSQSISPSRLLLQYDARAHQKTESMVENLVAETGYDAEDIEQAIANLVLHLGNELRVRKEVLFEPFGKLFYGKENNVLQFQATVKNLHSQFFELEDYPLIPLAATKKITPEETTAPHPITAHPKSVGINKNLLAILALLWIIFLGLLFCPSRKPNEKNSDASLLQTDSMAEAQKLTDSNEIKTIDTTTNAGTRSQAVDSTSTSLPQQDTATIPAEFQHETEIKSDNLKQLNEEIKHKKCVIIVGSFQKSFNAKRMITKVKRQKFQAYSENFGTFHRVGVKFDCTHIPLESMLELLKKKFAGDAWILKY